MEKHLSEGIKILKQGGIVIFPTDTAFGIGCRIDDEQAIERLFKLRKRPINKPTPVLFNSIPMVEEYATNISDEIKTSLMYKYWPGALTIILPANLEKVPSLVRGGGLTIGTRIPKHEIALELINQVDVPIIGTSANFHGDPTPYDISDINPQLYRLVDYVIPGVCTLKKESTVIDCSTRPWTIVRQGAIKLKI